MADMQTETTLVALAGSNVMCGLLILNTQLLLSVIFLCSKNCYFYFVCMAPSYEQFVSDD